MTCVDQKDPDIWGMKDMFLKSDEGSFILIFKMIFISCNFYRKKKVRMDVGI